jgi:hypothetical protein
MVINPIIKKTYAPNFQEYATFVTVILGAYNFYWKFDILEYLD